MCESIKNGFIIDECYYQLYNNDKEPVIVYSPHFSIDYEDERCCKSILLMHLPWSKLGEDGLLIKSKNKLYKNAVDAVSHKRKIKKIPAYFIEHMQQEIHCRDCFNEVNEINGDTGDVMDDDAVSIDERMNDINNLHDITCSNQCGDLNIPITTSDGVMNLPNVYQTLNSHKRSYLKSFVENELRKEITKMEIANQITGSQHCSVVSSDSYSVPPHTKYANHDEILQNVINQKNLFGDDQLRAFNKISECFSMNLTENADNHLVMFLSGEGGSGKTTLIKSLADNAKIIYGRLGGPYDPLLATAPTGSAANTIGGFTYHGILFASILRNGSISDTDAKRIAGIILLRISLSILLLIIFL